MLTLPEIVRRTVGRRRESAKYVRIIQVKKGWDTLGRGFVASASYSTKVWHPIKQKFVKNTTGPDKKPRRYVTVIVFLDPRLHVISSCSCADFKYRWEVALNHKQAAEIEYSNGELPVIRNPAMRAAQCKHLIALYESIKEHLKPKRNNQTPPINPPQVQTPPSVLKQQEEERKKAALKIAPIKIPKNVQRSVKPGKKQSTAPRAKPVEKKEAPKQVAPPAMMKAPAKKAAPAKSKSQPAKMSTKSKPAAKPAPAKNVPMMKAKSPAKTTPAQVSPPAMMRARK